MTENPPQHIQDILPRHGQEHLLRWWDELDTAQRQRLVGQIEDVPFDLIDRLTAERSENQAETPQQKARRAERPGQVVSLPQTSAERAEWRRAAHRGRQRLAEGKVGVILVAGGQGTRLDFPHPKGMYPIAPYSGDSLFHLLAEQVVARAHQAGTTIPYYVMTSDATHEETVAFFRDHNFFGLNEEDVVFFRQGNMPAVDIQTGRLLMAEKDRLSTSPDGHGGLLEALAKNGVLADMQRRGVEDLFYHQVDNPTVKVCDPAFLGFHNIKGSQMSTKVVAKRSPEEKMGVLVDVDGRTQIIEYSDLPGEIAEETDEQGQPIFWAGNTAVHVFRRSFLERLATAGSELPFHRAEKTVPYLDETGSHVKLKPKDTNAYKFERFIFDALPQAEVALVLEADRQREFHPVKNRDGEDSPATARKGMMAVYREWLEAAGVEVIGDEPIEIRPTFALDAEDVQRKLDPEVPLQTPLLLQ